MKTGTRIIGAAIIAAIVFIGFIPAALAQEVATEPVLIPDSKSAMWSALIAPWLPLIIAAINRERWSSRAKGALTFAVSAIAATGTSYFAGHLDGTDWMFNLLVILTGATVSYNMFWKPTDIAPAIERRTG